MDFDDNILDMESSPCALTFRRDNVATAFRARSAFTNLEWAGRSWIYFSHSEVTIKN
jgi:hypothetical protein